MFLHANNTTRWELFRVGAFVFFPILVMSANTQAQSLPRYPTATEFAAGDSPVFLAIADLNDDGIPDLVTANRFSHDLSVLLGQGDGTFQTATTLSTGSEPISVVIAELVGGDDIPDLAVADSGSDSVWVFRGQGDGTFRVSNIYAAGDRPVSIAVADLNNDGVSDLIASNSESDELSIWRGDYSDTFQRYAVGKRPAIVTPVDLNNDDRMDLVVANYDSDDLSVLLGKGDGTFQSERRYTTDNGPVAVRVADLNADGTLDLVVVGTSYVRGSVSMLLGRGDGTFQAAVIFAEGNPMAAMVVDDLDNDAIPDLVTTRTNFVRSYVSLLRGNGDGTFQAPVEFSTGALPTAVAVADLNNDDVPDLVTANYGSNDVSVLLGTTEDEVGGEGEGEADPELPASPDTGAGCMRVAATPKNGDPIADLFLLSLTLLTLRGTYRITRSP